jgi:hypothetical protein
MRNKYIHVQAPTATMNKRLAFKVPLQTELRFHLRRYEQPHSMGGACGATEARRAACRHPLRQQRQRPPLRVAELQQRGPQGGRCCNFALAHADARGARTSTKSRQRGLLEPPPPRHRRQGPSALRQIPTQILSDEWGTDLRVEAPYRCKGRTAPEHERRPGSARYLGRSSRAHGAATAFRQEGAPGAKPTSPTR